MKKNSRAKMCIESARGKWGLLGWYKLTPDMREAFVARELVYMMLAQGEEEIDRNGTHILKVLLDDCRQALQAEECQR